MKALFSFIQQDLRYIGDRIATNVLKLRDFKQYWRRFLFNRSRQYEFIKDYYSFLMSSSHFEACKAIIDGVDAVNDNPLKKYVAQAIKNGLDEGHNASYGMRHWFDDDIVQIFRAGEQAGNLENVLDIYSKEEEKHKSFVQSLFGGVKTQAVMVSGATIAYLLLASINWMGFPEFTAVSNWAEPSQKAYAMSQTVYNNIVIILIILVGGFWFINNRMKNYTGSFREVLDKLPPFSIYKSLQALRFFKLYVVLKTAKESDQRAFRIAYDNGSKYLQDYVSLMEGELHQGEDNIGNLLDVGLLPKRLVSRLFTVSRQANDEARIRVLLDIANYAEKEVDLALGNTLMYLKMAAWMFALWYGGTLLVGFALVTQSVSAV